MIDLKLIRQFCASSPDRLVAISGESAITWQQFASQTEMRIRQLLAYLPDQLPSHACIVSPNSLNILPWMAALVTLGIPFTGLDYTLPKEVLHDLTTRLNTKLLLMASSVLSKQETPQDFGPMWALRLDIDSMTLNQFDATYSSNSDESFVRSGRMDDPYDRPRASIDELLLDADKPHPYRAVSLTSGTSAHPKLVIRTKSFDQRRFNYFTERYGFGQNDRFLVSLPLFHAAGNGWARMFMSLGATLVFAPIDSPQQLATALCDQHITASVMTPATLHHVIEALPEKEQQPLALRWLLVGGKHFPSSQKKLAIARMGKVVYEYYGTTETGVNTIAEPADLVSNPTSVGRPIEGNSIAIVGKAGNLLPHGSVGTVAVASYMNMDCYGDGMETDLCLDGERYLPTADQGYLDSEGRLFLINRSGESGNIAPIYSLEDAIRELPCVADVALVQRKDQKINCAIVVRSGLSNNSALHQRIYGLATTRNLNIAACCDITHIPYSLTGKIRMQEVRSNFTNL